MSDIDAKQLLHDAQGMSNWQKNRFLVMIGASLMMASFLVLIAMNLYNSSGAAQLDLSRPGYESVREQVNQEEVSTSFPATGELTPKVLADFERLYSENASKVLGADGYSGNMLSDMALGLPAIIE